MICGKFSYVVSRRSALILLKNGTLGNAVDVFSFDVAFSHSRMFLLGSVG